VEKQHCLRASGPRRYTFQYRLRHYKRGQIAGKVRSADGTTYVAALWELDGTLTNLGILPGDFAAFATGINDLGQVVGNNFDSNFDWSHGFIWQNGVMTDINALIPADSNLFVISASNINERGQISGMATVQSGPHTGDIHAFLATPVAGRGRVGRSVADVATTQPKLPASIGKRLCRDWTRPIRAISAAAFCGSCE